MRLKPNEYADKKLQKKSYAASLSLCLLGPCLFDFFSEKLIQKILNQTDRFLTICSTFNKNIFFIFYLIFF